MKLSEYKEDYYTFTGKLSDINRQIAFAGIAIIWIFKKTTSIEMLIDPQLVLPAVLIIAALAVDILQYIYQSITWAIFYTYYKRKGKLEDEVINSPESLNYASWGLFILKVLLVIIAYCIIFKYLIGILTP